ncbi:MAG: zf-HC2 domain-containing protein [Candidatus Acidiferrales bacterium]
MDWNCVLTEERLSDHLDGLLSPDEAAAFAAHVAGCEQCGKLVARVGGLVNSIQRLESLEAPPQMVTKILDATLGPRTQKQSWGRWFTWIPVLWQPRFTMGVATVVATLLIVVYTSGFSPTKLKKMDLNPASMFRAANRQAHLTYARSAKFVNDLRVVYEIQSRLQPESEQEPSATPAPAPEQNKQQQPSTDPQEKSQTAPHPGHTQARGGAMFAVMLDGSWMATIGGVILNSATLNNINRSSR